MLAVNRSLWSLNCVQSKISRPRVFFSALTCTFGSHRASLSLCTLQVNDNKIRIGAVRTISCFQPYILRPPQALRHFHVTPTGIRGVKKPFLLADIGEGITECEVIAFHVKVGDVVQQFSPICEVQSDKASVEITSRFDGKISAIHYKVGDVAKVGSAIVDIEVEGKDDAVMSESGLKHSVPSSVSSGTTTEVKPSVAATVPTNATNGQHEKALSLATPAVRRVAKENKVDLSRVKGTGPEGRILKGDVLQYMSAATTSYSLSPLASSFAAPNPPNQTVPLNMIQKQMFKSMTASLAIPHFGYSDEVCMDALAALRTTLNQSSILAEALKDPVSGKRIKLTYMPFVIKALSVTLSHHPILNSRLIIPATDAAANGAAVNLEYRGDHNVGVAMDTPSGLLVPSIKSVQTKSIIAIAQELERLKRLAGQGALTVSDLGGTSITLSNIGNIGGTLLHPLLVGGQVCIGGLGKMMRLPRYASAQESDVIVPTLLMPVSFNADHRIIDGATLARFVSEWQACLQDPALLLAQLT